MPKFLKQMKFVSSSPLIIILDCWSSSNSFNKLKKTICFKSKKGSPNAKVARCCQYSGLKPGGGFRAFHRVLVYLRAASGTEPSVTPRSGWSPLTDRWCIGRLIRKRPLHSSAYQLILQWCRALRVILHGPKRCTAHRVMPYLSFCHETSLL